MRLANNHLLHIHPATRTRELRRVRDFRARNRRAAMGAKFRAGKNHSEAGGTRHHRQAGTAMLALGGVGRNRRAARRAIHCFRSCHCQRLYPEIAALPMANPLHNPPEFVLHRIWFCHNDAINKKGK
jgi:hypothetical protein